MKLIKKIAAIMLSIMMVLGMASVVSAERTASGTSAATKGKITIENVTAGQTYKIYRILELESYNATAESYAYKATNKWKSFIESDAINDHYVTTDANSYVTWKNNADVAEFAQKALAYAKVTSVAAENDATVADGSNTVTFDNLDLGYYLVESSVGALCGLTTTNNEVTIAEKNGVPSVEKKVQEDSKIGEVDEWGDSNTADIGQTVNFKTTITARPGAQNYVLHDKMYAGLTFDANSVQVKLKKKGETTENVVVASNYEVKTNGLENPNPCTFHVVFTQAFCDTLEDGDQIIVTYSATLDDNAVPKQEYMNETWLKYGENSETTHDTTITKTFELPVFKYTTKDSKETALAGATFTLSKNRDGSEPINLVKTSEKNAPEDIYRVAKTGDTDTVTEVTTPDSGKFTIKGLDADTYYLTETKQPDGYNKLSAPIKVVIGEDRTITVNDQTPSVNEVKVENKTGSILPSTGGSGTTMIYILGAILVLGSSVVLITKKRMR
jgi:fimbrial isopeptide formation D2 family protein/LPXTG-motif cell wall-anchored protein